MRGYHLIVAIIMLAVLIMSASASVYDLVPTDDIWVSSCSTNPSYDPLLRAYGHNGYSVAPGDFPFTGTEWSYWISYSYLKWDLSSIPKGIYSVNSAVLTVIQQIYAPYTYEYGVLNPLEARAVAPYFSESTWYYDYPQNQNPGVLFGVGDLSAYTTTYRFPIPINLLVNEDNLGEDSFNAQINNIINSDNKSIALALCSPMESGGHEGTTIYRLYSKEAGGGIVAPKLNINLEPLPTKKISEAKQSPIGERVYLKDVIVTANFTQSMRTFFVEEKDRTFAIAIKVNKPLVDLKPGEVVSVVGKINLWDSAELGINAENIIRKDPNVTSTTQVPATVQSVSGALPASNQQGIIKRQEPIANTIQRGSVFNKLLAPVSMTNGRIGGGAYGSQPAIAGASGYNNVGMLIKTTGVVTGSKVNFANPFTSNGSVYWIDDGAGLSDGYITDNLTPARGVAVLLTSGNIPSGNITVTGIVRVMYGPNGVTRIITPIMADKQFN